MNDLLVSHLKRHRRTALDRGENDELNLPPKKIGQDEYVSLENAVRCYPRA
ncbi:MAG: hypothetical protein ABSG36_09000 [Acidimicrobiales bacterium]